MVLQLVDHCCYYCFPHTTHAETMLSFGDFKKIETTELIRKKDPLGLNADINNSDIESYTTIKTNTKTSSEKAILPKKNKHGV